MYNLSLTAEEVKERLQRVQKLSADAAVHTANYESATELIRIDLGYTIEDGSEIKFKSPVNGARTTGLIVYYPNTDETIVSTSFAFADAHGNNVGAVDHLFAENAVVKVILDLSDNKAFVQNADTNAYLEGRLQAIEESSDGVGKTTENGGVIFNDLENNQAGEFATAFGTQTIATGKASIAQGSTIFKSGAEYIINSNDLVYVASADCDLAISEGEGKYEVISKEALESLVGYDCIVTSDGGFVPASDLRISEAIGTASTASGMGAVAYSRASKSLGYRTQTGYPPSEEYVNSRPETFMMSPAHTFIDVDEVNILESKYGSISYEALPNQVSPLLTVEFTSNFDMTISISGASEGTYINITGYADDVSEKVEQRLEITSELVGRETFVELSNIKILSIQQDNHTNVKIKYNAPYPAENVGQAAVAIGSDTAATANNSFAGGYKAQALGSQSFAFGGTSGTTITQATGQASTAIGSGVVASGAHSFASGSLTTAMGSASHAEGANTLAEGENSHAEGNRSFAFGSASHTEGLETRADGNYSHAEGLATLAGNIAAHAEGNRTEASGLYSHAEGNKTIASGNYSHAEGENSWSSSHYAHAEGRNTVARGQASHAEGFSSGQHDPSDKTLQSAAAIVTDWSGKDSTSKYSLAFGRASHVEGKDNLATGEGSHAEGYNTFASNNYSHAEGIGTIAAKQAQHVQGQYNIKDTNKYVHIVGNGTSTAPSNAHTLDGNGNAWFAGNVYVGGTNQEDANKLATEEYVNSIISGGAVEGTFVTEEQLNAKLAEINEALNKLAEAQNAFLAMQNQSNN